MASDLTSQSRSGESLRIMHVLSGDLWAGAEVMAVQLLKELHRSNNSVVLALLLNQGRVAEELLDEGVHTVVLDESRLSFTRILQGVHRILHEFQPHVVHAHRYKENLLAYLATRRRGRPALVSTQHGMPETKLKGLSLQDRLKRRMNIVLLARGFDSLVVVSDDMRKRLSSDMGMNQDRVQVIRNGIELPSAHFRERPSPASSVVGSCGRLVPIKNYRLFVETAAQIVAHAPDTRFILAGDGPEIEPLYRLHQDLELKSSFCFLGHVKDISKFYQGLHVYMSTSIHEGIPMSILEAMGRGLPVVAPRVGGFPEIIDHGEDGFLIPGHDPEQFARSCLKLLSDPELLEQMGKAGQKKIAEKFSIQRMTEDYYQLYEKLSGPGGKQLL